MVRGFVLSRGPRWVRVPAQSHCQKVLIGHLVSDAVRGSAQVEAGLASALGADYHFFQVLLRIMPRRITPHGTMRWVRFNATFFRCPACHLPPLEQCALLAHCSSGRPANRTGRWS